MHATPQQPMINPSFLQGTILELYEEGKSEPFLRIVRGAMNLTGLRPHQLMAELRNIGNIFATNYNHDGQRYVMRRMCPMLTSTRLSSRCVKAAQEGHTVHLGIKTRFSAPGSHERILDKAAALRQETEAEKKEKAASPEQR